MSLVDSALVSAGSSAHFERNRRILVVDDNEAIHHDFHKILCEQSGASTFDAEEAAFFGDAAPAKAQVTFDVSFAFQGQEGLEIVRNAFQKGKRFAVAFMDVRMPPGWDGMETTLKLWEIDPDIQIVICTAYSDYSWEETMEMIASPERLLILKKPFDTVEVLQIAHAMTEKWSLLQAARANAERLEWTVRERTLELQAEIAERKRNEEALRFTQFSVDNASDAMFWVSAAARFLYVNGAMCRSLGYSRSELLEKSLCDINPEFELSSWPEMWERMRREFSCTFESLHRCKDGRTIPVELTFNYFQYGGRELVCASARDIAERKQILAELGQARDAALESMRLKSEFLANMSHEIRTPMNAVIGLTDLLLDTELNREQRDFLDTIRGSADLLLGIINDILDFSKIEAGKLTLETCDFDLRELVENTLDVLAEKAQSKGIELAACISPSVHTGIRGDRVRLQQILTNIVGNAVKFTARGEVVVHVARVAENESKIVLRFEVQDTGIGMSEEAQRRIFDAFSQADGSTTRQYGGTGLGLTISRRLVESMNGEIGVRSEAGQGSTFWFTISFEKQTEAPRIISREDLANTRVLIVDDNATNRRILQSQAAELRLRSSSVTSGGEALKLLRDESAAGDPFSLAILDMQMPEMDGLTLAKSIKADPALRGTHLIILSSLSRHFSDEALREAGIEQYLSKPVKQARLYECLASVLGRKDDPQSPPVLPSAEGTRPRFGPLRILLAEDNDVNRKVALKQLQTLGLQADAAANGEEAIRALQRQPYEVILMDCQMPVLDGYEATRRIRQNDSHHVYIIAMTASAMPGDREKCLDAGMDDYISKPVRISELEQALLRFQQTSRETIDHR